MRACEREQKKQQRHGNKSGFEVNLAGTIGFLRQGPGFWKSEKVAVGGGGGVHSTVIMRRFAPPC